MGYTSPCYKGKIDLIQKKPLLFGCFSKMGRRPINKMLI